MKTSRPKILFLAHRVPYPPNRGDRIRSFNLLKYLAARAEVHLAYLAQETIPDETHQVLAGLCSKVTHAHLHPRGRWASGAWSLATGRTATQGLFRSPALFRTIVAWAKETRYDAVVVYCSSMGQYLNVPGLAGTPVVVDLVDVDSQKWFDYAQTAGGLKRLLYKLEGGRLRRLECELADRADAVTLVSHAEAALFRQFCPAPNIHAVPNGVDLDYFQPRESPEEHSSAAGRPSLSAVFVGALDYRANIDGVTWFCQHAWPQIHRHRPDAKFLLVGSSPGPAVKRLAEIPGVHLIGAVPDVRPYLAEATFVAVPLRVARGLQNKVIEALAMSKGVVSSPQAAEGLDIADDVHLRLAATPEEWVQASLALLDDPSLCRRLGAAGRAYVETHHRWEAQLSAFAPLLGLDQPNPAACETAGCTAGAC
jgi:sugar transferase (PEP-CTERM/EpsH1 system associated)